MYMDLIISLNFDFTTANTTRPPGGDKTDLATSRSAPLDSRRLTNVLMVTTTVRMLNGVHGHTSYNWPAVALSLVFVVRTTGLQDGFVDTTATSNDTNHSPVVGRDHFLGSGRQLDAGLFRFGIVSDDGGVVARRAGQSSAIAVLLFNIADDGTFRHRANRQNIADLKGGFLSAVDELSGVHSLDCEEVLLPGLESVRVTKVYHSQRCTTARIVNDVFHNSFNVAVSFGKVFRTEFRGSFAMFSVGLENSSGTFTLGTNDTSHFVELFLKRAASLQINLTNRTTSTNANN